MEQIKDHEYCLRCGRKLKNSKARELGYGMVCIKKLKADNDRPLFGKSANLQSSQKEKDLL